MGRRRNWSARALVLWLTLGLAACGGNVTVARGFESRQVLPLRDTTFQFSSVTDVAGADPMLVYSTQPEGAAAPTQWSLDLATGALQAIDPNAPPAGMGSSGTPHYTCAVNDLLPDGSKTLEITDWSTGVETDIDGVTSFAGCVRADGTFDLFRRDPGTGAQVLWTGPYQQLAPVPLPFDVLRVAFYEGDAAGQLSSIVVVGAAPTQPSAAGIYAIDVTSNIAAQVVPPMPASAAWAAGAPQVGSLQSNSVAIDVDIDIVHGHYTYGRRMSDGGTTMFASGPSSGGATEMALFQLSGSGATTPATSTPVAVSAAAVGSQPIPHLVAWQVDGAGGAPSQLLVWDDDASQVTVCPSTAGAYEYGAVSPDGAHVIFSALQLGGVIAYAPLQLLSLAAGQPHTCTAVEAGNPDGGDTLWAEFSGEGTKIAWISKTQVGINRDLWTANSDGSNPQMILSGPLFAAAFVNGTTHLELSYDGDLVWLDVTDPTHFSYVAEKVFGQARGVGGAWFVAGYDYSAQDASGLLGVVDLESGRKLPISPAVSQFLVERQTPPADGSSASQRTWTGISHVVYLVRGRNPSSQDGIWLATIDAAQLQ